MGTNRFRCSCQGWSDPLQEYFQNRVLEGGLTNFSDLSTTPFKLEIDLNEWVRFEQPGVYTVLVKSGRVSDIGIHRKGEEKRHAEFDTITLRIVPRRRSGNNRNSRRSLARCCDSRSNVQSRSSPRKQAASDLRFLGTEEAIDLLTQYYREDKRDVWGNVRWDCGTA